MRKTILLLTLAIAIPQLAMAWGYIGHKAIAEIAERNLTPKANIFFTKYTSFLQIKVCVYLSKD